MVLAYGCGTSRGDSAKVKKPEKPRLTAVRTSSGTSPFYSAPPASELLWEIHWEDARIEATGKEDVSGEMNKVTGTVYEKTKVKSRFSALKAVANRASKQLELRDTVRLTSLNPDATLRCDRVIYFGNLKRFHAVGRVMVQTKLGNVGPIDDLWANADLTKVATNEEMLR